MCETLASMGKQELNRACIGREYVGDTFEAKAEEMLAFANAIDEDNPHYLDTDREDGVVAHPSFVIKILRGLSPKILIDPDLNADLTFMVHGEQAYRWHAPIRPGDQIRLEGTIRDIENKSSGQVLRVAQRMLVGDTCVVAGEAALFFRGFGPESAPRSNAPTNAPTKAPSNGSATKRTIPAPFRPRPDDITLLHSGVVLVSEEQPRRYAEASGDFNPIHLDPEAAAKAGLPGVILHGTCTLAYATSSLVNEVLDGDPARLESLSVRFSRTVSVPNQITTDVWSPAPNTLHFEDRNRAGETVLARGIATHS